MSDFQSKSLNSELLKKNDLILTMETTQMRKIIKQFTDIANLKDKTFTLKGFNGETKDVDIPDPYMTTPEYYKKILEEIEIYIKLSLKRIIKLNKSQS